MNDDDLPAVSPGEAAMMMAYARLVALLDGQGLLTVDAVADDLGQHARAVPPQCKQIVLNLAEGLRPAASRMAVHPAANVEDPEDQVGG